MNVLEIDKLFNVIEMIAGVQAGIAQHDDLEKQVQTRYGIKVQQPVNDSALQETKQERKANAASLFDAARNEMLYDHVVPEEKVAPRQSLQMFRNVAQMVVGKTREFYFAANANLGRKPAVPLPQSVQKRSNILSFTRMMVAA